MIVSSVGVTIANAKLPETPPPPAQLTGGPTQKPGLAGFVWLVGPPKGLIAVLPVTDVLKSYVLPTIVALALPTNAGNKAAARYGARISYEPLLLPTGLVRLPQFQTTIQLPCTMVAIDGNCNEGVTTTVVPFAG